MNILHFGLPDMPTVTRNRELPTLDARMPTPARGPWLGFTVVYFSPR
jgi:hypothetical protein